MSLKQKRLASAIILIDEENRKSKKHRIWVKEWLLKKEQLSHMNIFNELKLHPDDYRNFLRMDENAFKFLLDKVTPLLTKKDTHMRKAISAEEKLIVTLRYLATGRSLEDLKFSAMISTQALGHIIPETCKAIFKALKEEFMQLPNTSEKWQDVASAFDNLWNFPNCGGAVDGKHVRIAKPVNSGSYYYNYKQFFSVVLMDVVDANYEFLYVHSGTNGRVSDGGVIEHTKFYEKLLNNQLNIPSQNQTKEKLPFVFLGDDAFSLLPTFLKPYSNRNLTHDEEIFNYRLSSARRVVENAFGILASRFRIFHTEINMNVDKIDYIIMASCILHNFLRRTNRSRYTPTGSLDVEDLEGRRIIVGDWRKNPDVLHSLQVPQARNSSDSAKLTRKKYETYFVTKGKVPWQEEMI